MKIKILGSGASEGIPSVYCACPVCTNARKAGGKDVRRRTSCMLDDDTLIDFSPDMTALSGEGLDLTGIKNILITHSHSDHFDCETMLFRTKYNIMGGAENELNIYGNETVISMIDKVLKEHSSIVGVKTRILKPEEIVKVGKYTVTPLKGNHISTETCLAYLISDGCKYYFHCTDSAIPYDETFEYLRIHKIKLSLAVLDCTCGDSEFVFYGHMNLKENAYVKERLLQIGAIDSSSRVVVTHIAHCCGETHETLVKKAAQFGIEVGYDGLTLEI